MAFWRGLSTICQPPDEPALTGSKVASPTMPKLTEGPLGSTGVSVSAYGPAELAAVPELAGLTDTPPQMERFI
jgi:hypothetical protein